MTLKEWVEKNNVNLHTSEISCGNNGITSLHGVDMLPNLKILKCDLNKITSLEPIKNLTNLIELGVDYNKITSLDPIKNLKNIKLLRCGYNELKSLDPIKNLTNIEILYCDGNDITSLEPLKDFINLTELHCSYNNITSLEPLKDLINLTELTCEYNNIKDLSFIPKNLGKIMCDNNPLYPVFKNIPLEMIYYVIKKQTLRGLKLINMSESYIKTYEQFINELNHQSTGSGLHANQPGYGQGAHHGNWGIHYGRMGKSVRSTYGEKGDKMDPNLPGLKEPQRDLPEVTYDPTRDEYLHEDDVRSLIQEYEIKCKQNSEEPEKFDVITPEVITYVRKYLNN